MSDTTLGDGQGPRGFGRQRVGASVAAAPKRGLRLSRTTLLRILVLFVAGASGYGAIELTGSTPQEAPQVVAAPPPPPPIETEDVLIANADLPLGKVVTPEDLVWTAWPKKLVGEQAIRRSAAPKMREDMIGALVRSPLMRGEPIRAEKIVKATGSGILAAMLPTGYRAMAINIDAQGSSSAGGFILPNDRVDVIRTTQSDPSKGEARIVSETLLANVRVLAIGQNIQERNGERVVTGSNATLEVDPAQAELLASSQRTGQISLVLRSLTDVGPQPKTVASSLSARGAPGSPMFTVGVMRAGKRQEYNVPEITR